MIVDSHFTPDELPQHRGWGHSDWREVRRVRRGERHRPSSGCSITNPAESDKALEDLRVEAEEGLRRDPYRSPRKRSSISEMA